MSCLQQEQEQEQEQDGSFEFDAHKFFLVLSVLLSRA
jgi:hypothetical protein